MSRLNNRIKKLEGVHPSRRIPISELDGLFDDDGRGYVTVAEIDEILRAINGKTRGVRP